MATTSNTITATAGQTEFSFSFPYLKKESIKVTIDAVATTAFTIPDNNPTTVILDSGATAGQIIKISRFTSTTATPATFFSGGAIRSQDLNNNFDSILYITQERENQTEEIIQGGIADGSITSSKLADQGVTPTKLDRAYVEKAQTQSFELSGPSGSNWYPFAPWPSWCNHIRYDISAGLDQQTISQAGFYLTYGNASGRILFPEVQQSVSVVLRVDYGQTESVHSEPLTLKADTASKTYYRFVYHLYRSPGQTNVGAAIIYSGFGNGTLSTSSNAYNITAAFIPHTFANAQPGKTPDRMGALIYGGTSFDYCQVQQTFLADGLPNTYGTTPTPI